MSLPPPYTDDKRLAGRQATRKTLARVLVGSLAVVGSLQLAGLTTSSTTAPVAGRSLPCPRCNWRLLQANSRLHDSPASPLDATTLSAGLAYCEALSAPKPSFGHRLSATNERADPHEPAYLLRNATIYTGTGEVIEGGDVLIQDGLIKKVSRKTGEIRVGKEVQVMDLGLKWVTPGIVDIHSHMVGPRPLSLLDLPYG